MAPTTYDMCIRRVIGHKAYHTGIDIVRRAEWYQHAKERTHTARGRPLFLSAWSLTLGGVRFVMERATSPHRPERSFNR